MPTIGNPRTLDQLIARIERVAPDAAARWGTLTAPEMLCHLGDAGDSVTGKRPAPGTTPSKPVPLPLKWIMLYTPMPFPKGVETRVGVNPRKEGTRPADFAADRVRVIDGLRLLASANPESLATRHFRFGTMSQGAWHHWAAKHVDHHLRQFGV